MTIELYLTILERFDNYRKPDAKGKPVCSFSVLSKMNQTFGSDDSVFCSCYPVVRFTSLNRISRDTANNAGPCNFTSPCKNKYIP